MVGACSSQNSIKKLVYIITAVFALYITLLSWQSDDAYHAYIMARHLVEGHGFVYNIGERVNASTCPLFTLIVAFGYLIFRNMFLVSLFICILFSTLAFYTAVNTFCKTRKQVLIAAFSLMLSSSFISFTSAGLENCLLFYLSALFLKLYFGSERYNSKQLLGMALLISLIAMTRMDAVLLFVPGVLFAFLLNRDNISFVKAVLLGFAGLLPFMLWELFSTFYYGFPFPNTAYAKLGTSFPESEYIVRGFDYFFVTLVCDSLTVVIPLFAILIAVFFKNRRYRFCVAGVVAYILYVFYIGGDFMLGRHYTVPLFVSVIALMWTVNNGENLFKVSISRVWSRVLIVCFVISVISIPFARFVLYPIGDVADERKFYFKTNSLVANAYSYITAGKLVIWNPVDRHSATLVVEEGITSSLEDIVFGIDAYYYSDTYLVDKYALSDPFLARLSGVWSPDWRIGHVVRTPPTGYETTVRTGENVIQDENLREYYEIIKLITRGPLFDRDRIQAIIDINTGKYDYLLEAYELSLEENCP